MDMERKENFNLSEEEKKQLGEELLKCFELSKAVSEKYKKVKVGHKNLTFKIVVL